jgi:hypothetical protein
MKLTIEKKTIEEVEIVTPCYRKIDKDFMLVYLKFDSNFVIKIYGDSMYVSTYSEYSNDRIAEQYNESVEISKGEFFAVFDNLVNRYKTMI